MSDVCYRVCNKYGYMKYEYNSLDDLDAYLEHEMAKGLAICPITRIVEVISKEIPLTNVAVKYNAVANKKKDGETK